MLFSLIFIILLAALLEAPMFTIIGGLSMVFLYFVDYDVLSLQMVIIEMNRLASMPVLVALPLFTFVGCLLTESGAPKRMMNFLHALLGWLPGGLAMAALCSCAFFTALTGASGVTIVALGGVLYPMLRRYRYEENFSLGLLTTSGSLGLLFPPSLPIILYGVVAQVDIGIIFKAAFFPGMVLIFVLCMYAFFREMPRAKSLKKKKEIRRPMGLTHWEMLNKAFQAGGWDWPIMVIIIFGVFGGYVTISEVAAVVAAYVVIIECFVLKEIDFFKQVPEIMVESAKLSGAIIIILAVSLGLTGYLVDEQIPGRLLSFLTDITGNKYVFLAGLNVFLLAVGCMMDIFSAIVIVVPIMVPIAVQYGIDPIHLCVIFLVNLEIGYATPPVGINLFISSIKFQKPVPTLYRASIPYLLLLLACLVLVTYFPLLSLFSVH